MMDSYQAQHLIEETVRTNNLLIEILKVLKNVEKNQPNPLDHG